MNTHRTESEAIKICKLMLKDGFSIAYMNQSECQNFIWGYLYDNNLQYHAPVDYVDQYGNNCSAIVYENK